MQLEGTISTKGSGRPCDGDNSRLGALFSPPINRDQTLLVIIKSSNIHHHFQILVLFCFLFCIFLGEEGMETLVSLLSQEESLVFPLLFLFCFCEEHEQELNLFVPSSNLSTHLILL